MKRTFIFLLACLMPALLSAQMFSVSSIEKKTSEAQTYFRIGTGFNDFVYTGNPAAVLNNNRLNFNHNSINFQFESASTGFELGLSLANSIVGLNRSSYFNLSIYYTNDLSIIRKENIQVGIPLRIGSELVTVTGDASPERFSQTAVSFGAGAYIALKLKDSISFTNYFTPGYGFSSSSGGFFGGSMAYLTGKSRLNFLNFIGNKNLSIGYDFRKFIFDIDKDKYDYNLKNHLITIGFSI